MTDRDRFLGAIRSDPADDIARLAFADWLDENGSGDPDAATAEFIRASCWGDRSPFVMTGVWQVPRAAPYRVMTESKHRRPMPRLAYKWIAANWRRLVPSVGALTVNFMGFRHPIQGRPRGGVVKASVRLANVKASDGGHPARAFGLTLWRGFVHKAWVYSTPVYDTLKGPLLADQPLCEFTDRSTGAMNSAVAARAWGGGDGND